MAITIKTYYCGESGTVKRLDDLTPPWVSVNVPSQQVILNDIKTDPTNKDKVFTVGSNNRIYVSSNAGAAWVTAGGTYLSFPATTWYEVWPISPSAIVVCGSEGRVALSTDGGLNFSVIPNYPTPSGLAEPGKSARAIHFPTPLIGVVGFEDKVFLTTNGGTSWTFCNSGIGLVGTTPGLTPVINGIHVDLTGQIITVHGNTDIWRSTNAGVSFTSVYSYTHFGNGKHLTWFDDTNLWGTGDFGEMIRSTNGGASWTLIRTAFPTISSNNAAHFFRLTNGVDIDGFWNSNQNINSTVDAGFTGSFSDNSPVIINAVWTLAQIQQCYELTNCGGKPIPVISDDDLAQYVGFVVQIQDQCFQVELSDSCQGAITLFPQGVPQLPTFSDCIHCNPPDCFQLTDCTGQTPVIITSTNLSDYVGQVIKLCEFLASPVIPLNPVTLNCTNPNNAGIITQVTGPTTGFYYNYATDTVLPYTNPSLFTTVVGNSGCFGPGSPSTLASVSASVVYTIQFFLGTTPVTNPIHITRDTTVAALQYLLTQNTIYPGATITVNYWLPVQGLNVNILVHGVVTETEAVVTVSPSVNSQSSFTTEITGECICYTVESLGPCEFELQPPPPLDQPIIGCFPDCECCLGPPPPEPEPPYIPTPPEIDKQLYRICESQCDIDANQSFANAMYEIFKFNQYGISSCCPRNINQIWLKKELSDLSKIKC